MAIRLSPWTLLRGVIEPASVAVWILDDANRTHRQERALRVWRNDMHERSKWEKDTGDVPAPPGKPATARVAEIEALGLGLALDGTFLKQVVELATTLLNKALSEYAEMAIAGQPGQEDPRRARRG